METPNKDTNAFRAPDGTIFVRVPDTAAKTIADWMRNYEDVDVTTEAVYELDTFVDHVGNEIEYLFGEECYGAGFENMENFSYCLGLASDE